MNKRKTVNIRVHRLQRWTAKCIASKLDCPIHEMVNRLFAGDAEAIKAMREADAECRARDEETG
jgi:hypothetical protein